MTNEHGSTAVVRDEGGTYYLLTPELLAQARVPAERVAEIERLLNADDTGGFLFVATDPSLTNAGNPSVSFLGTLIKVAPEMKAADVAEDFRPRR